MNADKNPKNSLKLLFDADQCLLYGTFIKASRGILGLSQDDFSRFLGVSRSTLVRLENGIAPLKKSLCEAAVDLLKTAGIESDEMIDIRYMPGVPSSVNFKVNYQTLFQAFFRLPRDAKTQAKLTALFGDNFVAPLKDVPLRKK